MPGTKLARRREATQTAILDAASTLIAEKGVDGFTISEVGLRGGINRALIYHYFKNRETLVTKAIDHILRQYERAGSQPALDALEANARMNIEHPEIGRFFYQMLLNERPLLALGDRILETIRVLEDFKERHTPEADYDPAFGLITVALAQMSWAFSRHEFARLLGISVEEADERFIKHLRTASQAIVGT